MSHRTIHYLTADQYEKLPKIIQLDICEREVIKLMRFGKYTFVDEETYAWCVMSVCTDWSKWHEPKGFIMRYKILKDLRKSFNQFRKLMSKKEKVFPQYPLGSAYYQNKTLISQYQKGILELEFVSNRIEVDYRNESLTHLDYIDLYRMIFTD